MTGVVVHHGDDQGLVADAAFFDGGKIPVIFFVAVVRESGVNLQTHLDRR